MISVDCVEDVQTCKRGDVKQLPMMRVYMVENDGFYGQINKPDIYNWIRDKTSNYPRHFNNTNEIEQISQFYKHVIVAQIPPNRKKDKEAFFNTAYNTRNPNDDVYCYVDAEDNQQESSFQFYHIREAFIEDFAYNETKKIPPNQCRIPLVEEISPYNAQLYMESQGPVGFYFIDKNQTEMNHFYSEALIVAKKFRGKMIFTFVDNNIHWRLIGSLGLSGDNLPGFTIEQPYPSPINGTRAHYPLLIREEEEIRKKLNRPWNVSDWKIPVDNKPKDQRIEEATGEKASNVQNATEQEQQTPKPVPCVDSWLITAYVEQFLSGEIPLRLRSEPIPKEPSNALIHMVGDTFNEIILSDEAKDKYQFVAFTAPWCHKCKKLKPELLEMAEEVKEDKRVVFATMDLTLNDYPPVYTMNGFPTLYLFPAGDKTHPIYFGIFYSPQRIRRFLKNQIPNLAIAVDEEAIRVEEQEEKKKEKEEKRKRKKEEEKQRQQNPFGGMSGVKTNDEL
ncbi:MAG: putative protein disulfide isomerase [Streblomastix strix]|uniref:Thioredoxin domain-containing protein n=1 Tax=Streblomastix strix TaxID=222440 RepID=A0A5J4WXU3_9EUKA|nr:MAG: putative protein disulfide isomerase [Streblomastix strix]